LDTLQAQLDAVVQRIRDNDAIQHRFQAMESEMLALNSLPELIAQTLTGLRNAFDLDDVSLALVDEARHLRLILRDDTEEQAIPGLQLVDDPAYLQRLLGQDFSVPYLGPFKPQFREFLFADAEETTPFGSAAVLPLLRRGCVLGSLSLASTNAERFRQGMATDFLARLSQILAVCLENTVNFELLRRASLKDMLTGVNNRRFFDQRLDEEINRVMRSGERLSCLFLDIDHFKRINDTYGHQAGDMALVAVAHCIRTQLRNNDVLARYGGEEFVALLEVASEEGAAEVAERIRRKVESADIKHPDGMQIAVTLSVGIATLDPRRVQERSGPLAARLLSQADKALYQAKEAGRNQVMNSGVLQDGDVEMTSPKASPSKRSTVQRNRKSGEDSLQTSFNW
jgi:diguanylate cyclase (GGDEF)-like protein